MKNKKLKVSIGIPAYNEDENIKKLLNSLLEQYQRNYVLKEILVVSDGSTDNTNAEVKSIKDVRVSLFINKKRLGSAVGQNKIIKIFTGDVLILINADVLPSNRDFIFELIKPIANNKNISLVGPKILPIKAKTFFEKIINYSVSFKDAIFEKWQNGNNLYMCRGAGRAFRKDFAKMIFWKESLSEDAYTYLLCIRDGYKFKYQPSAKLYFKSPDNFEDHKKQSARFISGPKVMSKYFDEGLVKKEYSIPKKIAFLTTIEYLLKNPLLFFLYLTTLLIIKINPKKGDFAESMWKTSSSSKTLKI